MLRKLLKPKKNAIFACQITEGVFKAAKCVTANGGVREISGLEAQAIAPAGDDKELIQSISRVFKKLSYAHGPIIACLPRNQVTSRYLKVPAQSPEEIESIVFLQAPRYLPYPAEQLISGYQIISTDKNGYSNINLIIAHKDAIERIISIFKEFKPARIDIVLSSYGLVDFCQHLNLDSADAMMVADIDSQQTEIAVISAKKLIFSRAFKFTYPQDNWQRIFIDEINKTQDAYLRETAEKLPAKVKLIGISRTCEDLAQMLNKEGALAAEVLAWEKVKFSNEALNTLRGSDYSSASIVGLCLGDIQESLILMPQALKEATKKSGRKKELFRLIGVIAGIILVFSLAVAKNMNNKTLYLKRLKAEISKISNDAKPLEEIEKRIALIQQRSRNKFSVLDILYELYKNMPEPISLVNLNYEEDGNVILRGQSPELNYVFQLVSQLEKTAVFKNFGIKVRYASKKRVQAGEIIDFEVICSKK